jgi:predicted nucleic acid-binding protein
VAAGIQALIDSGPIVAYYNGEDDWHAIAVEFFEKFKGQLVTTEAVVTEVMYCLAQDVDSQSEFLADLHREIYRTEPLAPSDYRLVDELNRKYSDVPGDFADLSLIVIAERLNCVEIVSLDSDFDIYRAYGKTTFKQLLSQLKKPRKKR